jgi:hypothetical protein
MKPATSLPSTAAYGADHWGTFQLPKPIRAEQTRSRRSHALLGVRSDRDVADQDLARPRRVDLALDQLALLFCRPDGALHRGRHLGRGRSSFSAVRAPMKAGRRPPKWRLRGVGARPEQRPRAQRRPARSSDNARGGAAATRPASGRDRGPAASASTAPHVPREGDRSHQNALADLLHSAQGIYGPARYPERACSRLRRRAARGGASQSEASTSAPAAHRFEHRLRRVARALASANSRRPLPTFLVDERTGAQRVSRQHGPPREEDRQGPLGQVLQARQVRPELVPSTKPH